MKQKQKLVSILGIILIGYIVFAIYAYIVQKVIKLPYPNGTFLFNSIDQYMDFFNVNFMVHERRPYVDYYSSYPPFALLLAWPFSLMADYARYQYPPLEIVGTTAGRVSFCVFIGIFTCAMGWMIYRFLKRSGMIRHTLVRTIVSVCLIITAPYVFMVDRGNYLLVTIVCCLVFAYYYNINETISAIFLGIAIALKIYPLFLFLLLFIDRKWKSMGIATAVAGALSIVGLLFLDGGVWQNVREFGSALLSFGGGNGTEFVNVYYCVGLTSLLRLPFMIQNAGKVPENVPVMLIYLIIGTALTLWSVWSLWKETRYSRKMLILMALMVFLTPNSYLYNLMYLLPAVILYIVEEKSCSNWIDRGYAIMLGLLMIPKAYYYFEPLQYMISVQPIIDGCLLLAIILFYNIFDRESSRREEKCNYTCIS